MEEVQEQNLDKMVKVMTQEIANICGDENKPIQINIPNKLTPAEYMAIVSIRRLSNPFRMVDTKYVMKDLGISKSCVYRLFQRDDFPSINVGKTHQVMILAYLMWKLAKRN